MMMLWVVALERKGATWSHLAPVTLNLSSHMTPNANHLHENTRSTPQPSTNSQIRSCRTTSPNFIISKLLGKVDFLEQLKQVSLLRTAVSKSVTTTRK